MGTKTQAEQFQDTGSSMELPMGVKSAVLIMVFDDNSVHTSVPKGDDSSAMISISAAADMYGIGTGEHGELEFVHPQFPHPDIDC